MSNSVNIGNPHSVFYSVAQGSNDDGPFVSVERRCGHGPDDVMFGDRFTPKFAERLGRELIAAGQKAKARNA
ncbi:Uncharacterised protein [Mycobacteroides abscessus]|uniref:hypothetical protein n=1 Tax=Mycobacteroides abscessus TaxID=36809 RepID=UPI0005E3EF63|nr:hypothetical protein [Mycobacteroides abscessus]CPU35548.1 Uncharacterised protein [Mycobacteroides abscessus]CPX57548.1 Uncharacterised protein [Mycobacteroides abscessus]CPZ36205.1 Uncharacterised protein [Mycobacteroides abscessus]